MNSLGDSLELSKVVAFAYSELTASRILTARELASLDLCGGYILPIEACIDCRSVFDALSVEDTKQPCESSLIMLLLQIKESLRSGALSRLWWITTGDMVSDALNKGGVSRVAVMLLSTSGSWKLREDVMFHEEHGVNDNASFSNAQAAILNDIPDHD